MKAKFEFDLTPDGDDKYYYAMYSSAPALTEVYSELRDLRRHFDRRHESNSVNVTELILQLEDILNKPGIHEDLYS